jgi:hypothetical protein
MAIIVERVESKVSLRGEAKDNKEFDFVSVVFEMDY